MASTAVDTSYPGGAQVKELAEANPYKDVVRYEHKNRKWNLQHVDFYSDALAIGLMENGLVPGDVVLSWLPPHFSESVSTSDICCYSMCRLLQWHNPQCAVGLIVPVADFLIPM